MLPRARLYLALALIAATVASAQDWSGPASFEVRVDDEKGRAIPGAEVALAWLAVDGSAGPASALTDGRGRLAIGGLAPGRWALEVRHPGHMTFRATIVIGADVKPAIESAAQQNVPGAKAPMRVRLGKASGRTFAAQPVARPAPPIEPAPAVATPEAPTAMATPPPPAAAPVARPAPPAATPAAAPAPLPVPPTATVAPTPVTPPAPAPRPTPASAPIATPAPAPRPSPTPALSPVVTPAPPASPIAKPAAAAPPAVVPLPVPPASKSPAVARPAAPRTCVECRPGEQALWAETFLAAGGAACPAELRARLESVPPAELEALRSGLPDGCALLRVDLPRGTRFVGFRYEATGEKGAADCFPNRPCPAGECRFVGDPVIRREGDRTTVLGLFESTATAARGAALTVYYTQGKR